MFAADMNLAPSPYAEPPHTPCEAHAISTSKIVKILLIPVLFMVGVFALFLLHVLGTLRRQSSHKLLHGVVLGIHTLSYTLVSYTLGLMQDSKYIFNELPVWAVSLLMLLGGTDNLMACSLNDLDNWKSFHMKHLLKGALVIYIVAAYGVAAEPRYPYLWPILLIIFVNLLQSYARIKSMRMASKSHLLRNNLKPIADYMKREDSGQPTDLPGMKGYRYVVAGEQMLNGESEGVPTMEKTWDCMGRCRPKQPRLKGVSSDAKKLDGVTTVEQIWDCKGSLLQSEKGSRRKDVCLSMALAKMLNRRFAGLELAEAGLTKTNDFVFRGLLAKEKDDKQQYERPFRVIEVELGFVYDMYYTRYPYLYHEGRHLALCLPVVMFILCLWLTYELYLELQLIHHITNYDPINSICLILTLVLMAVVTFLEAFQLYLHMASGWFKVALIRSYITRPVLHGSGCFVHLIMGFLLGLKAHRPWGNKLGQYSLLQYYDRKTINFLHYVTLGLADKAMMGRKRGKPVKLSTHVKQAVVDSLLESNGGHLMNGVRSLRNNGVHERLSWACDGRSVTRTILVWHVATTICKQRLEVAYGKHDNNPHCSRTMMCCRSSPKKRTLPELSEEDNMAIHKASSVASDLSQYCAYLLAFAPDLLPDHCFDSGAVLDNAIEEARRLDSLRGAKTVERKSEVLMKRFGSYNNDEDARVVVAGAVLAGQLMEKGAGLQEMVMQWKVLADFWAEMMLYVAPGDDAHARDHLEALAWGGELITHLWALLTHAGVLERGASGSLSSAV